MFCYFNLIHIPNIIYIYVFSHLYRPVTFVKEVISGFRFQFEFFSKLILLSFSFCFPYINFLLVFLLLTSFLFQILKFNFY